VLLSVLGFASSSFSQWKKIATFNSQINTIYFKDISFIPIDGFVSLNGDGATTGKLWHTNDGGLTWQKVSYPIDNKGLFPTPGCFTFKDQFEGWFCGHLGPDIFRTIDGGMTWSQTFANASLVGIQYIGTNNRVIASSSGNTFWYSLDGINFINTPILNSEFMAGIAFSDNLHGIISPSAESFGSSVNKLLYTIDGGGATWNQSVQIGEHYGPIGIKGTSIFYALSEDDVSLMGQTGTLIRSDDGGINWRKTYQYTNNTNYKSVTGTLQYNSESLFLQTSPDNSEGIMFSRDSGNSFYSICGPSNYFDTRFYVRDSFIYAADKFGGLWLNTTGIGSNSTPQLSIANKLSFQTDACKSKDSIITITFFDSCNGLQAKLVNASIVGTSNFSLVAPFNSPRTIHANDSIIVHYDPSASLSDSASLHLRFHLGWKNFDTEIQLVGTASFHPTAQLSLTKLNFPGNCSYRDSLITISCFDSCSGTPATLDSISLEGSKNFSLLAPSTFPKVIHSNDSLLVRYDPLTSGNDTSILHLHFHLGAKEIDTAITLYGVRDIFPESKFSASQIKLLTSGCSSVDSIITFSFFDSCSNSQAELVNAVLQGSNNFSFSSPSAIPRTIHPDDSLLVSYNPNSSTADTASLHLRFHLGWKDFDTVIMLTGAGRIPKENVQFIPSLSANAVSAGSSVDILIKPNKPISGRALQSISFDLNYNSDLLDGGKIFSTGIPGASITVGPEKNPSPSIPLPKLRAREIVVTGNDLSLDPNIAIADLKFMAMVTDTTSTPITISNLKLNDGDLNYQNCILSADTSATNFTEVYLCGDSTLSKYLRTGNILSITSIHPNPAQDEVEIELHSAIRQDVNLEVFDALGARVFSMMQNITGGANTIHFDTKGLSAGVYLVKVGGVSQSLVISR